MTLLPCLDDGISCKRIICFLGPPAQIMTSGVVLDGDMNSTGRVQLVA